MPRANVQPSWRTKALFALAFVLAGIIAWIETADDRASLERAPAAQPATVDAGPDDLVEMEVWEPASE